ncbi:MDR/zinc-dependent alcohol dehydrogenase-like family protein [Chthoniobacter flavus]|uniref:hypothetical protein n=1 Tax=Chthoniobacter flavus TaxID=191863 RepID=UPI003B42951F
MKLLIEGFRVFVYSRSPKPNFKADIAEQIGAGIHLQPASLRGRSRQTHRQISTSFTKRSGEGHLHLRCHAGCSASMASTFSPVSRPRSRRSPSTVDNIMRNITLKNQAIIGTVNASPAGFRGRHSRSR